MAGVVDEHAVVGLDACAQLGERADEKTPSSHKMALAIGYGNLGKIYLRRGELPRATTTLRRSIELGESLGPEDPSLADPLTSLGAARLGEGDPDEAVPLLTRALGLREKQPGDAAELAETRFALAQALWSRVDRRAQARDLATQARDGYASRGEVYAEDTQRVAHWLQTHRP